MSEGVKRFTQGIEQGYTIAELDTRYTLLTSAGTGPIVAAAAQNGLAAVQTYADNPGVILNLYGHTAEQRRQYFEDMQQVALNKAHI